MQNVSRRTNWLFLSLLCALQAVALPAFADAPPGSGNAPGETRPEAPSENGSPTEPQETSSSEPPSEGYDFDADTDPAALTDFRKTLDGHGTWEEDPTYGLVWVPDANEVGSDFAPYASGGHWGLGDGGEWLWVSDYDWGWATFHYGRWARIGERRWGWIPGRVYAPAWVVWRTGYYDDYYVGWAPMPPVWYWRGGFAARLGFRPPVPFFFCASQHIFAPRVFSHIVPAARVGAVAVRTQPYVAASGAVGGGYHPLASIRNPSLAAAHVPINGLPVQRSFPDARATAFARTASISVRSRGLGLSYSAAPGRYPSQAFDRARPVLGATGGVGSYPSYRSASPSFPGPSSGSVTHPGSRSIPSYGGRTFTPPSGSMSRSFAPSPAFRGGSTFRSGGSSFHSAPSFRGGGGARHR
jgi:hypothetical protein